MSLNTEPLPPQDNPQLEQDPPEADSSDERYWWGPFSTFISRRISSSTEHYFIPKTPIKYEPNPGQPPNKVTVLRLPGGSALYAVLSEAWSKGVKANVWFGFPWINRTGIPGIGATVRQAEILWSREDSVVESAESVVCGVPASSTVQSYIDTLPKGEENVDPEPFCRETVSFARKSSLRSAAGKLYGLWHYDFRRACEGAPRERYIHEQSILELLDVGTCANGHVITMCTHF
ncbi:hypothetical protein KAU88_09625 [Candidatus Bathyarchaeota archaeon]|nr:hypothetical protein [Candidatus Bathyarchaeota archaeon]